MRIRFWLGVTAVLLIAAGSVIAAVLVYADDHSDFHEMQREQAASSARQAEASVALAVGQLANVAAFFQAEDDVNLEQYEIIAEPLLDEGQLRGTAFIERVPDSRRGAFERRSGAPIFERREPADGPPGGRHFRRAAERPVYYPIRFGASTLGSGSPIGFDLASDPQRGRFLRRARDTGMAVATPPVRLLFGGRGINVYRPV